MTVITPTVGKTLKRSLFWIGAALFTLLIAVVSFATAGSSADGKPLDATNAAPAGGMAVAEVLRQQGVEVTAASSLTQTRDAIDDPASTTLLIYDPDAHLDAEQLDDAVSLADTVVLVDPAFGQLRAVAPDIAQAGFVDEDRDADCSVSAVQQAGTVSGKGSGYRVVTPSDAITTCLASGDDVYSLVQMQRDGGTLTLLGTTDALSNEFVADDGNAALALNLLGQQDHLVWYLPSIADIPVTGPATLAELTPGWVSPVLILLVLTFITAAIWRGRRFGPLVVENLPVTVRASETMLGRARLYEKSSARLRALDALRVGSIQRLAELCGLPRTATVDDIVHAISAATGAQVAGIRRLLVDAEPSSDRELVELSDALLLLERDVATATRP